MTDSIWDGIEPKVEYLVDPEPNGLGFYSTTESAILNLAIYRMADTPELAEVVGIDGDWSRTYSRAALRAELLRLAATLDTEDEK